MLRPRDPLSTLFVFLPITNKETRFISPKATIHQHFCKPPNSSFYSQRQKPSHVALPPIIHANAISKRSSLITILLCSKCFRHFPFIFHHSFGSSSETRLPLQYFSTSTATTVIGTLSLPRLGCGGPFV